MITRLAGKLLGGDPTEVVVDVQGVGFAVSIPLSTYDKLPRAGSDVILFTHLVVREDALQLYGFATVEERRLFRLLATTVTGIGPRLALNILSAMPVKQFCQAIAAGDIKALSRISGIGKRSAERLIVELKERLEDIDPTAAFAAPEGESATVSREAQDAISALETLGFKGEPARNTVRKLCRELKPEECSAENLIRKALSTLNA
ncbi:MAG: Holliday junction DNA helicase RuvA [Lentisphaerae bacterium RIFOXYB12_FULL_65_16]|nr:MAG: Holliday junction DNA helicase RuvA [Lentisphaerae bacterium RIFOXYA12_64_32]OGV89129.1 MAG: Holliday junction DNA helicase RuvA [Lentisphaerae bacterium RIFOXYB12_FULL_65_16]